MNKIPTLFLRDPENMRVLLPQVNPGCEWVLNREGAATRKYDGTCVMFDGTDWWARREVKPTKVPPPEFVQVEHDETTGKRVGWIPMRHSGFRDIFTEAVQSVAAFGVLLGSPLPRGTFELIGPKINGNPEGASTHRLERHSAADQWATADVLPEWVNDEQDAYDHLSRFVSDLAEHEGWEGIVWHHPDGRMVKLKARDFNGQEGTS